MSDQDPAFTQTTRTTVVEPDGPTPINETVQTRETTVVDRRPSNTAWWVAGMVAVVAIIGVVWMVLAANGRAPADAHEIEDAIADARLQGQLEGAQDSLADAAAAAMAGWAGPGATADGHPVAILANVQDGSAARAARETPAEGVGLFRTELCFLNRDTEPTVEEQAAIYGEVLDAFAGCKVVIRTLDAGSDKPLKFVGHPDEANPALGVRGIRIEALHPEVLERQLDAIALAAERTGAAPWVMAPMIATPDEAKRFADRARERRLVPGVMIEVPAAALLAEHILDHVEFLSIGTNDLAQYTMAADRMSAELATLTDPWQPGVLALVAQTARAGAGRGKPVGVCGEAAADPLLACVLVGLGITSLSAAAAAVTGVGAKLASVTLQQCRDAAAAVLTTASAADARAAALAVL